MKQTTDHQFAAKDVFKTVLNIPVRSERTVITMAYRAAIFDLDGVIVDTAKFHYLAWKELAAKLGFAFTKEHNERLKGVSRMASLEILLEIGNVRMSGEEKLRAAEEKNNRYVEYIGKIDEDELLPGVRDYLEKLRSRGIGVALGSASKNAAMILERTGIAGLFDVIVDGNDVSKAKPDPEVFLLGAKRLGKEPEDCAVFEDAAAGIQAARAGGMYAVGVGSPDVLGEADAVIRGLFEAKKVDHIFSFL